MVKYRFITIKLLSLFPRKGEYISQFFTIKDRLHILNQGATSYGHCIKYHSANNNTPTAHLNTKDLGLSMDGVCFLVREYGCGWNLRRPAWWNS